MRWYGDDEVEGGEVGIWFCNGGIWESGIVLRFCISMEMGIGNEIGFWIGNGNGELEYQIVFGIMRGDGVERLANLPC